MRLNKFIAILGGFLLQGAVVLAQSDNYTSAKANQENQETSSTNSLKNIEDEYVMMRNGNFLLKKKSDLIEMSTFELELENGYHVYPGGLVVRPDGSEVRINEGEMMYFYGKKKDKVIPIQKAGEARGENEKKQKNKKN